MIHYYECSSEFKISQFVIRYSKTIWDKDNEKYVLTIWYEYLCTLNIENITVVQNITDFC